MRYIFYIILIQFLTFPLFSDGIWKRKYFDRDWNTDFRSIDFIDSLNGIATGADGTFLYVLKTEDGGKSWFTAYKENENPFPKPYLAFDGIWTSKNNYFVSYLEGFIKRSNDGGYSFQDTIKLLNDYDVRDLYMQDDDVGIAFYFSELFYTEDGWDTHQEIPRTQPGYYSNAIIKNGIIRACKVNYDIPNRLSRYIHTSDFGKTWFEGDTLEMAAGCIFFLNDKIGWIGGDRRGKNEQTVIYKTTDGGLSWFEQIRIHDSFSTWPSQISFIDEDFGIACGSWGQLHATSDGGKTWIRQKPEGIDTSSDNSAPPLTYTVGWAGRTPIVGSGFHGIYRYEGDFFDAKKKLATAVTLYPTCGADSMSSEINFDWGSVKDAVFYHFQLSLEPDLNSFIYEKKDFAKHSLKVGDLDSGQTYYWRVRGYNYDVVGEWSEVCEFRVVKKASSVLSETNDLEVRINQNRLSIILKKQYYNSPKISIQDMQGKVIFSRDLVGRNEVIDLSDLADGVYFYSVIIDGIVVDNNKFIVSE